VQRERLVSIPALDRGRQQAIWQDFLPAQADHINGKTNWINSTMTRRITFAIIGAHRPLFREQMSSLQYLNVGRGFRREELVRDKPFPFYGMDIFDNDDDDDMEEADLEPTGEPVPLIDFCEPATVIPEGEECPICAAIVGVKDKDAAVTKCSHLFHQECLEEWVNESCREASNACPTCRTEMCRQRERRLVVTVLD
jgi:hypothetical protein